MSDLRFNTAGGTLALELVSDGSGARNTAFGYHALFFNITGVDNTAVGAMLLNELQRQRQEFQRELAVLRALVEQRRRVEAAMPSATIGVSGPVALPR